MMFEPTALQFEAAPTEGKTMFMGASIDQDEMEQLQQIPDSPISAQRPISDICSAPLAVPAAPSGGPAASLVSASAEVIATVAAAVQQPVDDFKKMITNVQAAIECPCCKQPMRKPMISKLCGHSVCSGCLPELLRQARASCPLCRKVQHKYTWVCNFALSSVVLALTSQAPAAAPAPAELPEPSLLAQLQVEHEQLLLQAIELVRVSICENASGLGSKTIIPEPPVISQLVHNYEMRNSQDAAKQQRTKLRIWDFIWSRPADLVAKLAEIGITVESAHGNGARFIVATVA